MIDHAPNRYRRGDAQQGDNLSAAEPAIALEDVTVQRGGTVILRDLTLSFPAGSVTAIVGRSGAGKSTLIRTLNGLTAPSAGRVMVGGIGRLDGVQTLREHRRRTATIFQDHALIDRLPAMDNVLLGLADQRHPLSLLPWSRSFRLRAAQALDEVGLLHRAWQRTSQLSGGEQQRVGFARALVRRPRLLLADEPFASVDPSLVRHLSQELRLTVMKSGLTLVIVLHQIETALTMADRIVGLADGKAAFICRPQDFDGAAQARIFQPFRAEEMGLD